MEHFNFPGHYYSDNLLKLFLRKQLAKLYARKSKKSGISLIVEEG
jgi:hypothetical protein